MDYSINGKEITIGSKKIYFNDKIVKVKDLGESVLLLLKNTSTGDVQKQPLNNILAIDEDGNILWRISDITKRNEYYQLFSIQHIDGVGRVLITVDCMGIRYKIRLSDLTLLEKRGFK